MTNVIIDDPQSGCKGTAFFLICKFFRKFFEKNLINSVYLFI